MLEGPRDLFRRKCFDDVAGLDALDSLHADTALEALQHLTHIILEALERAQGVLPEDGVAPLDAHPRGADDLPLDHRAPEDRPHLGDGEELLDLGPAVHGFPNFRGEHAAEGRLDVVEDVVDDAVVPEVDAIGLGLARRLGLGLDVEAEHDGIGRRGKHDIRLIDRAHRSVDDLEPDLVGGEALQRLRERFHRALHVGLEDEPELLHLARLDLLVEILEGDARRALAFELVAVRPHGGDLPRLALDRKSTRLNSSHGSISYAVFCLKKKKNEYKAALMMETASMVERARQT